MVGGACRDRRRLLRIVVVFAVRAGGLGLVALDVACGALGVGAIVAWQATQDPSSRWRSRSRATCSSASRRSSNRCATPPRRWGAASSSPPGPRCSASSRRGGSTSSASAGPPTWRCEHDDRPRRAAGGAAAARRARWRVRGALGASASGVGIASTGRGAVLDQRVRERVRDDLAHARAASASRSRSTSDVELLGERRATASQTVLWSSAVCAPPQPGLAGELDAGGGDAVGLRGASASASPTSSPMNGASAE